MLKNLQARKYFYIIFPLFIGSIMAYLDRVNVAFAALTMNKDMGFSAEQFGMGAGILFFGYMLFGVPGALIAERKSPRVWLAIILVVWGAVLAFMAFMQNAMQFYILRFLLGACEASFFPVVYAIIMPRWFNTKERPAAMSLFLSSMLLSGVIGAPLAGWLLDVSVLGLKGWQSLFLLEAFPAIALGIGYLYCLPDWPKDANWLSPEEKQLLTTEYEQEITAKNAVRKFTVWESCKDKKVLKLCGIFFLWMTGFWGFNFWMPTVLKSVSGWSNSQMGWLIAIPMTIAFIGFILWGMSSSKSGEKRWHMALPLFMGAIAMAAGPFVTDPWFSLALVTVSALGLYIGLGVWWSYPTTFLSGSAAAAATSLINSIGCTSGWAGPYFTGYIKDMTGSFQGAYIGMAVSIAIAGLFLLTLDNGLVTVSTEKRYNAMSDAKKA
ncbi:MFS transporter [Sporomusa acidovorans]|uniref:Tartrate transporter n=1 Tax=Sporomusa acidovorans (strain ATCC 49682 / DSM 3132 / Mol) TaxID=1123286 RepID=A0ABZ3J6C1_SPOA4|nr:MFS transporter [Sporomusa acidovorans]OZC18476.1 putative tartrate transporter [Sporomusa acidovorans DSM 3132]SDE36059.1 Sugar phosphate permease [Sporomusa acidovorans]